MKKMMVPALAALLCLSLFSCTDESNPGHYETPTPIFRESGETNETPLPQTDDAPQTQTPAASPDLPETPGGLLPETPGDGENGGFLPEQTPDAAPPAVGP